MALPPQAGGARLSGREAQVLLALARGRYDKEIAAELGITLGTVRVYRRRIQGKLRVKGLVPWVLVAWRLGMLDLGPLADAAMADYEAAVAG